MKFICLLLVPILASAEHFILQKKDVCFEARGNNFGEFTMQDAGQLTAIKLVHKSGQIACGGWGNPKSRWGCANVRKLSTLITTSDNAVVFPKPDEHGKVVFYGNADYLNADELVLINADHNPMVVIGEKLRLWNGEDRFDSWEGDNSGQVCADVYASVEKVDFKLQKKDVCFSAKGNAFGSFKVAGSGNLKGIKLVHKSGSVGCTGAKHDVTYWGCGKDKLDTMVTDAKDKVIFPVTYQRGSGFYKLPGRSSRSESLVLNNPGKTVKVMSGQTLRIWYGEDLFNHWEFDNKGTACADVYAAIDDDLRCRGVDNGCCTEDNPCDLGDGDCDSDSHCSAGLKCGTDNCPWGDHDDCCVKA